MSEGQVTRRRLSPGRVGSQTATDQRIHRNRANRRGEAHLGMVCHVRSRCGCISVVEKGRFTAVESGPTHPIGHALCAKGQAGPEQVYSPDRLLYPMRRTNAVHELLHGRKGWTFAGYELEANAARCNYWRDPALSAARHSISPPGDRQPMAKLTRPLDIPR